MFAFFFSSRRRHTRSKRDWSSDVCSSDLDWLREIDIVVHCARPSTYENGEQRFLPRQVDEIVEVQGVEGNRLTVNPLFEGTGADLKWIGGGPRFLAQLEHVGFAA